jgi:hypothetical protein
VNDRYLDRNYGGILIIWDRCSAASRKKTRSACTARASRCNSWDPLWANAEVYAALARDSWHAALGRQVAGLVQAPGLAAGGCGASDFRCMLSISTACRRSTRP